jgi:RNA polymerase sigma-70 factor (sigma-E family)
VVTGNGRRVRVRRDEEFTAYVAARARLLRRSAYLLCGDWHRAEDLTQSALTKVYLAWSKVSRADNVDGYVRTMLVRTYLDEERRRWRRERPTGESLDGVRADPSTDSDQRLDLLRALGTLPPKQRAAVVLRCWEDLPIAEVAHALDCSEGTVKSQTSRGLAALRAVLAPGLPEGARR